MRSGGFSPIDLALDGTWLRLVAAVKERVSSMQSSVRVACVDWKASHMRMLSKSEESRVGLDAIPTPASILHVLTIFSDIPRSSHFSRVFPLNLGSLIPDIHDSYILRGRTLHTSFTATSRITSARIFYAHRRTTTAHLLRRFPFKVVSSCRPIVSLPEPERR